MTPTRPGLWVGGRWPGRTALPGSLLQPPQPARQEGRAFHLKAFSWHRRGIMSSQWELGVRKRSILIGESGQMIKLVFFFHNLDFPFHSHMLFFCSCIMWQISRVTKFCHIRKHPGSLKLSLVSNLDKFDNQKSVLRFSPSAPHFFTSCSEQFERGKKKA